MQTLKNYNEVPNAVMRRQEFRAGRTWRRGSWRLWSVRGQYSYTVYSYGTHYPISVQLFPEGRVGDREAPCRWFVNDKKSTKTTERHKLMVVSSVAYGYVFGAGVVPPTAFYLPEEMMITLAINARGIREASEVPALLNQYNIEMARYTLECMKQADMRFVTQRVASAVSRMNFSTVTDIALVEHGCLT